MIYVLTVHWQTPFWIPIQYKYLTRFVKRPFKLFAFLTGIERDYSKYFHYSCFEDIANHATKLNILADMVLLFAEDEDVLVFLDGDAFPVNDIDDSFILKMKEHELAAVQRVENNGDIQPHPSFCVTTVGFWKKIRGTWHKGFCWKDKQGDLVTDIGGNLLKTLQDKKVNWYKMIRSNRKDLHPLAFGIYDHLVYHHGFGFRKGFGGRGVRAQRGEKDVLKRMDVRVLNKLIPRHWRIQEMINPYYREQKRLNIELEQLNSDMLHSILNEEDFYKHLM